MSHYPADVIARRRSGVATCDRGHKYVDDGTEEFGVFIPDNPCPACRDLLWHRETWACGACGFTWTGRVAVDSNDVAHYTVPDSPAKWRAPGGRIECPKCEGLVGGAEAWAPSGTPPPENGTGAHATDGDPDEHLMQTATEGD